MFGFLRKRPEPTIPQQTWERVELPNDTVLCKHCGGAHSYKCPRIVRISYYEHTPQGESEKIAAVEYDQGISRQLWPDVKWPATAEADEDGT